MSAYDFELDSIYYSISNGEAYVTYKDNTYNSYKGDLLIPSSIVYDGVYYNVTAIGDYAFSNCTELTSVYIPNSYKKIGMYAFAGSKNLTSVTLPNTVTEIGYRAFQGCSSLGNIRLPNVLMSLSSYLFEDCTSLTSILIPSSVTQIGTNPFYGCSSLESITVSPDNPKYDSRDDSNAIIETETNTILSGCFNTVIPESVEHIASYAFYHQTRLTSINLHDNITSIGNYAFEHCESLTSITIPKSMKAIDARSFGYCFSMKTVTLHDSIESIGTGAFIFSGITDIHLPNSITDLGDQVFYGCRDLENCIIPTSITEVPMEMFFNATSLTDIVIPNNIKKIGYSSFNNCVALTSVTFGSGVETIESRAFRTDLKLKNIKCKAVVPPVIKSAECFDSNSYRFGTVYVRKKSVEAYQQAEYWKDFANIVGVDFPVDVNGDDQMTIADVSDFIDMLANNESIDNLELDANGDGVISIADVTEIIDMLLSSE